MCVANIMYEKVIVTMRKELFVTLVAGMWALAGCTLQVQPEVVPTVATPVPVAEESVLSDVALQNATYSGIYDEGPVTLTDGVYEGEPFGAGGVMRPRVELVDAGILYGDLDGDGSSDAAVILVEESGGSGSFTYVAAQLNQNGRPADAGAVLVGDRTQISSAAIVDGAIELEIVTQGPDDAACCPTLKMRKRMALADGRLAEVESEALGTISAADLEGTTWTLLDLNLDQQPALDEPAVTLSFADGQITGSGGCNTYSSTFTLDEADPMAISIAAPVATRMACSDEVMAQESAFFAALEQTLTWGYYVGHLMLYYEKDGDYGKMFFTP